MTIKHVQFNGVVYVDAPGANIPDSVFRDRAMDATSFYGDPTTWVSLDDALAWHERQRENSIHVAAFNHHTAAYARLRIIQHSVRQ